MDIQSIEEILESQTQSILVRFVMENGLQGLFIDEELIERLEEARELLKSNLKKLKRQRQLVKERKELIEALGKVVDAKREEQSLPKPDVELVIQLQERQEELIEARKELESRIQFDEDEMEDMIREDLEKFNKVRRALREEKVPVDERSKSELIDELFDYYKDRPEEAQEELSQLK